MKFSLRMLFPYRRVIGVYFILIGVLIVLNFVFSEIIDKMFVILSVLFILSTDITIRTVGKKRALGITATAASVAAASVLAMLVVLFKWQIDKIWPVFGYCASGGLILTFLIGGRRRLSLLIPGIVLALMSSLILLFTTNIITLDSKYLFGFSVALLFMTGGILMIFEPMPTKSIRQNGVPDDEQNDDNP